jgi:hypothetical protein
MVQGPVLLDDFMGDARQGAPDVIPGHDGLLGHKNNPLPGLARGQIYDVSLSFPCQPHRTSLKVFVLNKYNRFINLIQYNLWLFRVKNLLIPPPLL